MSHTVFRGARVFDGEKDLGVVDVHVEDDRIVAVGADVDAPADAEVVDGAGRTLLPGLIDAHTHTFPGTLEDALAFGVTTELDLFSLPSFMIPLREQAASSNQIADVRSASVCITAPGGHPTQLSAVMNEEIPTLSSGTAAADEIDAFIEARVGEGADYIKLMIEDGSALGLGEMPTLSDETAAAVVEAAHRRGLIALAHATSHGATLRALTAGVDGVTHLFIDDPLTDELISAAKDSGAFFISSLSVMAAITQEGLGPVLAEHPRAQALLGPEWIENLQQPRPPRSSGRLQVALDAGVGLHRAGVPLLAGTDASMATNRGSAHGISMHGELQLLVRAGLTPTEALHAGTALVADTFGLEDRGRIERGRAADLLLVDGDPMTQIDDTLRIVEVRRRGELARTA
jgi:imidazolonepropionase-like amidohydrolase